MSLTMYGRKLVIQGLWAPELVTVPTSITIALTRSVPVTNADVSQLLEPTAPEYTRVASLLGAAHWADDGYGGLYNIDELLFPQVNVSWGFIYGYAIIDPLASMVIDAGALMEPFTADVNLIPTIEPGTIMLGLSD